VTELVSNPRERLRVLVAREPGLHLRELPRRLGLSLNAVRYHLDALGAQGAVVAEHAGGFVRFYPPSAYSRAERAVLAAARVHGQRAVLEALIRHGPASFEDLRALTHLSKGSLHWHLKTLSAAAVIAPTAPARWAPTNRSAVEMALALTAPTAADTLADAANEIFDPPL